MINCLNTRVCPAAEHRSRSTSGPLGYEAHGFVCQVSTEPILRLGALPLPHDREGHMTALGRCVLCVERPLVTIRGVEPGRSRTE
jgi:hypothetical protein